MFQFVSRGQIPEKWGENSQNSSTDKIIFGDQLIPGGCEKRKNSLVAGGPAINSERSFLTAWAPLQIWRKHFVLGSETIPEINSLTRFM